MRKWTLAREGGTVTQVEPDAAGAKHRKTKLQTRRYPVHIERDA